MDQTSDDRVLGIQRLVHQALQLDCSGIEIEKRGDQITFRLNFSQDQPTQTDPQARIEKALYLADHYGGIDGAHHKMWVIDQMVRALTGPSYPLWREHHCRPDGPDENEYAWDDGIAP
jgi:hypothetical protein